MPIIISKDTTWKNGEIINLNQEVQVAYGVTLTIEPGAKVNGNGNYLSIYGKLNANGKLDSHITINDLTINQYRTDSNLAYTNLNFVDMRNGGFSLSPGSGHWGNFDITNSFFDNVKGFYLIFPDNKSSIVGNTFVRSNGLMVNGPITIKNNVFLDQTTKFAIESWGNVTTVEGNSFLSTDKIALTLREGQQNASMNAKDNYFGTSDLAIINSMILDSNDSLIYKSSISNSYIASPANGTPKLDAVAPTIAINSTTTSLTITEQATIVFNLSEAATDFTIDDVEVYNGKLSNFTGSGNYYSATFTLDATTSSNGIIKVGSAKFADMWGNFNADGLDANNNLELARIPTITTKISKLSVIVDKGVIGSNAVLLNDLRELIFYRDAIVTKHTVEYAGSSFDYNTIHSLISTVTRDGEFTAEFKNELSDFAPSASKLSYSDAVKLIGSANIDSVMLRIAGEDGNFVG